MTPAAANASTVTAFFAIRILTLMRNLSGPGVVITCTLEPANHKLLNTIYGNASLSIQAASMNHYEEP